MVACTIEELTRYARVSGAVMTLTRMAGKRISGSTMTGRKKDLKVRLRTCGRKD